MDEWMGRKIHGWMDRWMDGWMNRSPMKKPENVPN
jgi:hypothetical protein